MFNLNNIPIPVSSSVTTAPETNKNFPTVGLKNILQNSELLDLLLKPMSNTEDEKEKEAPVATEIEPTFTSELCNLNFDDFLPQNKPAQSDHDYLDYNTAKVNGLFSDSSKNYESAFLGQKLWSNDEIFQGEKFGGEYLGIEEFLNENLNETDMQFLDDLQNTEAPAEKPLVQNEIKIPPKTQISKLQIIDAYELQASTIKMKDDSKIVKNLPKVQPSISSLISKLNEDDGDLTDQEDSPNKRFFEDRLTLQPTLKKSKKQFVPNEMKDEKYWARRKKNNVAAKRSRDTRRFKENQIVIAATYLEHENETLRNQLEEYKKLTTQLQTRLSRYEAVDKI